MASSLKRTKRKSDLLTDIDMLLIVEKGIRGGVCLAIHQYAKDFDKNKKSPYLKYWDINNLYGWGKIAYRQF